MSVLFAAVFAAFACAIVWDLWVGESSADDLDMEETTDER